MLSNITNHARQYNSCSPHSANQKWPRRGFRRTTLLRQGASKASDMEQERNRALACSSRVRRIFVATDCHKTLDKSRC